ncbi:MAG: CinA family protein [Candidatus Izemoplasmatales bacterium]
MNPEMLIEELKNRKLTISSAESMTGGRIASLITSVAGSSAVFEQGFITYSNESKVKLLSVKKETIDQFSVISQEVALEMVEGLIKKTKCDIGISITGLAGPSSDEIGHEVGLCFIGVGYLGNYEVFSKVLKGHRNEIQDEAAHAAIALAYHMITR